MGATRPEITAKVTREKDTAQGGSEGIKGDTARDYSKGPKGERDGPKAAVKAPRGKADEGGG